MGAPTRAWPNDLAGAAVGVDLAVYEIAPLDERTLAPPGDPGASGRLHPAGTGAGQYSPEPCSRDPRNWSGAPPPGAGRVAGEAVELDWGWEVQNRPRHHAHCQTGQEPARSG